MKERIKTKGIMNKQKTIKRKSDCNHKWVYVKNTKDDFKGEGGPTSSELSEIVVCEYCGKNTKKTI